MALPARKGFPWEQASDWEGSVVFIMFCVLAWVLVTWLMHTLWKLISWPIQALFCRYDCVPPETACWNSTQSDAIRDGALEGWLGSNKVPRTLHIGWVSAPCKSRGNTPCSLLPTRWGHENNLICNLLASPHWNSTMLAPWAWYSSLRNCEKWTDAIYKALGLCNSSQQVKWTKTSLSYFSLQKIKEKTNNTDDSIALYRKIKALNLLQKLLGWELVYILNTGLPTLLFPSWAPATLASLLSASPEATASSDPLSLHRLLAQPAWASRPTPFTCYFLFILRTSTQPSPPWKGLPLPPGPRLCTHFILLDFP